MQSTPAAPVTARVNLPVSWKQGAVLIGLLIRLSYSDILEGLTMSTPILLAGGFAHFPTELTADAWNLATPY